MKRRYACTDCEAIVFSDLCDLTDLPHDGCSGNGYWYQLESGVSLSAESLQAALNVAAATIKDLPRDQRADWCVALLEGVDKGDANFLKTVRDSIETRLKGGAGKL
jgi:hypothetical protein